MMLPTTSARSPLFALAVSAGFALVFIFGFLAWQSPPSISFPKGTGSSASSAHCEAPAKDDNASINEILRQLYNPLRIAPDDSTFKFIDAEGNVTTFELPPKPQYRKRLGSDVLILDLETRPLPSTEEYQKGEFDWRKLNHVSGGVFNHYAYAMVHGYDYKFIHAQNFEDRHATWIKPSALANHIRDYKFIVFLDADATFRFMQLPIEWMLNYWKVEEKHSLTMALDPWDPKAPQYNSDRFNRTYTNTGFMVVQNNANVMEMLKAWHECPDDKRYKDCSQWKEPKFHEQSAFGEYIRYDYEESIMELPCAEANGYPGVKVSNCQGKFIRHYWFEKDTIKKDFRENLMNAITLPIQRMFADNTNGIVVEQEKNEIH